MTPDPTPNESDGFVERMRVQPTSGLPVTWRADILGAAYAHLPPPQTRRPMTLRALGDWLWPHSLAYAGLALVWVLILVLRLLTPSLPPSSTDGMVDRQASLDRSPVPGLLVGAPPEQMFLFAGNRRDPWP